MIAGSLALFCRYRVAVRAEDSEPGEGLVGTAVAVDGGIWADGWMIDVDGLGIYVSEADAATAPRPRTSPIEREAGSDPPLPVPVPGSRVLVRGDLSLAADYETAEHWTEAHQAAEREWVVRRIVRWHFAAGVGAMRRGEEVAAIRFPDVRRGSRTVGYSLDLELLPIAAPGDEPRTSRPGDGP